MTQLLELIRWALLVLGAIYFITESAIFSPIRISLSKGSWFRIALLYCPACIGFWVGAVLGHTYWPFGADEMLLPLESAIAAMALGAIWGTFHRNAAFNAEVETIAPQGAEEATEDAEEAEETDDGPG